ncbi:MAG TPA: hypothetical protein VHO91_18035, partial [Rhodopila sp.]|nr:hypothetical protein [Rhodopila sp.]
MLDKETISRLLEPADPAISLYLPLTPEQRASRSPNAHLRELIDEVEKMMTRDGIDQRRREEVLAPLWNIANDTDFAEHRDPALAIFS